MHEPVMSRMKASLTIAPRALTSSAVRENLTGPIEMPSLGPPAALHPGPQTDTTQLTSFSPAGMHLNDRYAYIHNSNSALMTYYISYINTRSTK